MTTKFELEVARRYFAIEVAAAKLGVSVADIIHLGGQGYFPVYVLTANWKVLAFVRNGEGGGWQPAHLHPELAPHPLRLYPRDLMRFEADPSSVITEVAGEASEYHEYGPDQDIEPDEDVEYRLVEGGVRLADCNMVLMTSDLDSVAGTRVQAERPLGTKERATLLKIIFALASEAKYDFIHATKASVALAERMEAMGIDVSPRAIEGHFKAALKICGDCKKG